MIEFLIALLKGFLYTSPIILVLCVHYWINNMPEEQFQRVGKLLNVPGMTGGSDGEEQDSE